MQFEDKIKQMVIANEQLERPEFKSHKEKIMMLLKRIMSYKDLDGACVGTFSSPCRFVIHYRLLNDDYGYFRFLLNDGSLIEKIGEYYWVENIEMEKFLSEIPKGELVFLWNYERNTEVQAYSIDEIDKFFAPQLQ